ncbi:MAG TPA: superoxide dismutase, partial [Ktedonobacteraceae bacterium]|nr:superoxide dismutase [Ktedonobacteraceae bacterium]
MAFELPPLPYAYDALEPYIDTQTMQLHHDKHHGTYVTNLNNAVKGTQFESLAIEDVIRRLNEVPENVRTTVRNNGGGHINHSMFWRIMKPNGGGAPTG